MGAMDDLLAEYDEQEPKPAAGAKLAKADEFPSSDELFGTKKAKNEAADFDTVPVQAEGNEPVREPNPMVMDPQTKRLVPQWRTYATFTDMPGQKFTAEQLGNIKKDTRMSGPVALAGGGLQGVTGYFGDELAAGIGALAGQGEYRKLRDENRRANADAKAGSPGDYAIGELGGGILSPLNRVLPNSGGKSLLTLANQGKAAFGGGLAGLGASNADLTKGEAGKALVDTGIGAGIGTAANTVLGGLGKGYDFVKSAPERAAKKADDALIDAISYGATPTEKGAMVGDLGKERQGVLDYVRATPELKDAVIKKDYKRAVEIVRAQKAAREKTGSEEVKALEERWGEQDAQPAIDALETVRAKYAANPSPESQRMAAEFQKRIDGIKERWIPEPPKPEPKGKELLATLSEGANAAEKQKIGDNAELFEKVVKKHKLGPAANDPEARYTAIEGAIDELGKRKETLYGKVKEKPLITDVTIPLTNLRDELLQTADGMKLAPAVDDMIKRIWASHGRGGNRLDMDVKELRDLITKTQEAGFAGPYFDPSVAQGLQRQVAGVMKGALDSHVAKHGGEKVLNGIGEMNKEYQVLLTLRDIAERSRATARLAPPPAPDTRTGRTSVGELFNLANTTENQEAKDAIMSGLTKQMDKGAAGQLAKINSDKALMDRIETPLAHMATNAAAPSVTSRPGPVTRTLGHLGHAGGGAAAAMALTGQWEHALALAVASIGLKYGNQIAKQAEPAMAQMVTAMRAGASRVHLEKIGALNKIPKDVVNDMVDSFIPRTAAGEAVERKGAKK